jgi:hypothetical protein
MQGKGLYLSSPVTLRSMEDSLKLPVIYKGEELEFPFRVVLQGFTTRYVVEVDGVKVTYERDDTGELRAVVYDQEQLAGKLPDRKLLEAITETLSMVLGAP